MQSLNLGDSLKWGFLVHICYSCDRTRCSHVELVEHLLWVTDATVVNYRSRMLVLHTFSFVVGARVDEEFC